MIERQNLAQEYDQTAPPQFLCTFFIAYFFRLIFVWESRGRNVTELDLATDVLSENVFIKVGRP